MIRVMVVDDSALVRKLTSEILGGDPEVRVCATAANGEIALQKLDREKPDVITMDIEMPGLGGLATISEIMRRDPTPIIVFSAFARKGATLTLQALDRGAVDFVAKPAASPSTGLAAVSRELIEKVKQARQVEVRLLRGIKAAGESRPAALPWVSAADGQRVSSCDIVAIGASTGGPVALKTVLGMLPRDFPAGIVVVQHMPRVFTRAFSERLDEVCALEVREAKHGDEILPARVLIAPGDAHMTVTRAHDVPRVLVSAGQPVSGHCPSVDVLMSSVARTYGSRAVGVIMTGMGRDGALGIAELRERGGYIIAQDRESSVVFGMNGEVVRAGHAHDVVPVSAIAETILQRFRGREGT